MTSLPLVLAVLLILATQIRSNDIFFIGFSAGVILDVLLLRPLGETSVFFLMTLFLMFMYEKKYEVGSVLFITMFTFIASSIYFMIFPAPQRWIQIVTITLLAFLGFYFLQTIHKKRIHAPRL